MFTVLQRLLVVHLMVIFVHEGTSLTHDCQSSSADFKPKPTFEALFSTLCENADGRKGGCSTATRCTQYGGTTEANSKCILAGEECCLFKNKETKISKRTCYCMQPKYCTGGTYSGLCLNSPSAIKCCADEVTSMRCPATKPLSFTDFRQIYPSLNEVRAIALWPYINAALLEFGSSPSCHVKSSFLAQVHVETAGLLWTAELASGADYEGNIKDLGNTQPGDGTRFKGRGLLQLTGRHNYGLFKTASGEDVLADPEIVALPYFGTRSAAWYWTNLNLNNHADGSLLAFHRLVAKINGAGMNHLEKRVNQWKRISNILQCSAIVNGVGDVCGNGWGECVVDSTCTTENKTKLCPDDPNSVKCCKKGASQQTTAAPGIPITTTSSQTEPCPSGASSTCESSKGLCGKCQASSVACHGGEGEYIPGFCPGKSHCKCCIDDKDKADKMSHTEAKSKLDGAGITIRSSGNCNNRFKTTCTSLDKIRKVCIDMLLEFKTNYPNCNLVVTGGTEIGHACKAEQSHFDGGKVDLSTSELAKSGCSFTQTVKSYVEKPPRSNGDRQWGDDKGRNYADEGNHWDITCGPQTTSSPGGSGGDGGSNNGDCTGKKQVCENNNNNALRGSDCEGSGHWGASRGSRKHTGIDILCSDGMNVYAPIAGTVSRSMPYANPSEKQKCINDGVRIKETNTNRAVAIWYITPKNGIFGKQVKAGDLVGTHVGVHCAYKACMTDHVHLALENQARVISSRVDPTAEFANIDTQCATPTDSPAPAFPGGLPSSERIDCIQKGQKGDCDFYKCANSHFNCKEKDYPLAYGYRYCTRFSKYYNKFNEQGKRWINEVRKCLMEQIFNVFSLEMSCEDLKSFAFNSHPDCYLHSADGFCKIFTSNIIGLSAVFEFFKDFFGDDAGLARTQVMETAKSCLCDSTVNKDKLNSFISQFKHINIDKSTQNAKGDIHPDIEKFANSGDCRFYDAFEERFPCSSWLDAGHIQDFEAKLCRDYSFYSFIFKDEKWITQTQSCLMTALLPIYRGTSIECQKIIDTVFEKREECYTKHNFCTFDDDVGNQLGTEMVMSRSLPIFYYGRAKKLYSYQLIHLRCKCHASSITKYKMIYNPDIQSYQKIRLKK